MAIDGAEALARTLEWIASQLRTGSVSGVSLEVSNGRGRLAVSFTGPDEVAPVVTRTDVAVDE